MEYRQWCKECYEENDELIEMELIANYISGMNECRCKECGEIRVWNCDEGEWNDEVNDCGGGL